MSDELKAQEARKLALSTAQAHVAHAISALEEIRSADLTSAERTDLTEAMEAAYSLYSALERRRVG